MKTIWKIFIVNLLDQVQEELPEEYETKHECDQARVEKGIAGFDAFRGVSRSVVKPDP